MINLWYNNDGHDCFLFTLFSALNTKTSEIFDVLSWLNLLHGFTWMLTIKFKMYPLLWFSHNLSWILYFCEFHAFSWTLAKGWVGLGKYVCICCEFSHVFSQIVAKVWENISVFFVFAVNFKLNVRCWFFLYFFCEFSHVFSQIVAKV